MSFDPKDLLKNFHQSKVETPAQEVQSTIIAEGVRKAREASEDSLQREQEKQRESDAINAGLVRETQGYENATYALKEQSYGLQKSYDIAGEQRVDALASVVGEFAVKASCGFLACWAIDNIFFKRKRGINESN